MMQTFRNNMKIVFYIIIIFFVGWMGVTLTGLDEYLTQQGQDRTAGMRFAGEVGERKIERATYEQRVQSSVNMATSQRQGGALSAWEIDQIADQVWQEMVNEIVLGKAYDRHEIEVYNSEIVEYIRGNPLPELRNAPALQTDGQFDYDKYLSLIANPQAANLVLQLEQDARQKIPGMKLFLEVASLAKLTDEEIERAYRSVREQVNVAYITFHPDSLVSDDEVVVSEQDVVDYYEEHKDQYQRPETASMRYVLLPLIPGPADTAAALDTITQVRNRIVNEGESWDSLAVRYSHGRLAASGGDLGWFARGDYQDMEMQELAFSLEPGEVSQPALTASGFQIVRTDSVRTNDDGEREVKARRILRRIEPGRETLREVRSRARALRRAIDEDVEGSFTRVATDSGFVVEETGEFAIGRQIPGLQTTRELLDFLHSAEENSISYPINVFQQGPQGNTGREMVMVAQVIERHEAGQIPLAELRDQIRRRLVIDKKVELARKEVEPLLADYENYDHLVEFAEAKGLAVDTSGMISRAAGLTGPVWGNEFIGTAFGLPVGVKSDLVVTDNALYLLEPIDHREADMQQLEQNREQLVQQLVNTRMQTFFSLYTAELMERMEIEDYRDQRAQADTTAEAMAR